MLWDMRWRWTLTLLASLIGSATVTVADPGDVEGECAGGAGALVALEPVTVSGTIPRAFRPSLERFTERFWDAAMVSELSEQYPCFDPFLPDAADGEESSTAALSPPAHALRGRLRSVPAPERVPVVRLSEWSGDHWAREEMVALRPRGRFVIDFELLSLPEETVYDTGRYTVDWVEAPDADHAYRAPSAPFALVEGESLPAANTVDYGEWSPDPAEARLPRLERGDPGRTIRRRESLAAVDLAPGWLDQGTPPAGLALRLFSRDGGAPLPGRTALFARAVHGTLSGTDAGGGWHLLRVREGRIDAATVGYRPPPCSVSSTDRLLLASLPPGEEGPPGEAGALALDLVRTECFSAWAVIRTRSHRWGDTPGRSTEKGCERVQEARVERWRSGAFFLALDPEPIIEPIGEGRQFRRYRVQGVHLVDSHLLSSREDSYRRSCETTFETRHCRQNSWGAFSSLPAPSRDGSGNELVVTVNIATGEVTGARLPRWVLPVSWQGRAVCRGGRLELAAGTGSWVPFETEGEFAAPDLLTTAPDATGLRSFGTAAECTLPRAAGPGVLEGGCSARGTNEGLNYETSWQWSLHLE